MFKFLNGQASTFLQEKFTVVVITYPLPRKSQSFLNRMLKVFKQFFTYQGPRLWNNLPDDLKNCGSIDTFKFMYKNVFNNSR